METVVSLVLTERIEIIIPMTYLISFMMAWYGPNSEIIGGVKLDIWHLKAVKDLGAMVKSLLFLSGIDFLSFVVNGILLWTTCKINVLKVMQKIQRNLWIHFAVVDAMLFFEVLFSFYQYIH